MSPGTPGAQLVQAASAVLLRKTNLLLPNTPPPSLSPASSLCASFTHRRDSLSDSLSYPCPLSSWLCLGSEYVGMSSL